VLCACAGDGSGPEEAPAPRASDAIGRSNPDRAPERVVIISIAGLQPSHYGAGGTGIVRTAGALMPNLATLAARGAYTNAMEPVLPAAPYPAHATLATGLRPTHHRVLGDELMGPQGLHILGIARERRIRGTPIWRVAQAAGHAVAALNWPLSRGADIEILMPDMGVPDREPEGTWFELLSGEASPWVVDRLNRLDPDLAAVSWPSTIMRDQLTETLACEVAAQTVTPGVWLLAFEQSGTALARDGPGSDGARLGLTRVDAALGRLIECFTAAGIADSTAFLVAGDRAMFPIHSVVYPNIALERVGLITLAPMHIGAGIAKWDAFLRSYGGAGVIYAQTEADALLARRALEEQAARTRAFRIVSAAELLRLDADPDAWFGLEALAGYGLGKSARGQLVQATERRGLGGYLPTLAGSEVGFVAWGAGIRPGVRVPHMSQVDVAPTAAALLGLRMSGADGAPVAAILGASKGTPRRPPGDSR
jgi:hypothetical protein